ncbi:3542_t:CDS:1 [Ambispora gerdemannii]|uniref:3542_t:CDS:1 n=1 Tax=Ambispora gerdemannii TaxID=144530 RepID=A0A9N8ZRL0_9GLOM|nr:3542_t:CDS:1 [Ambispora gerdemannii]
MQPTIEYLELSIISGTLAEEIQPHAPLLVYNLVKAQYKNVLTSSVAREFFGTNLNLETKAVQPSLKQLGETFNVAAYISYRLELYFNESSEISKDPLYKQLAVLCLAASCLNAFVQNSWTGPAFDLEPQKVLPESVREHSNEFNKKALELLSTDGEEAYHLTSYAVYLLIARTILVDNAAYLSGLKSTPWWSQRVLFIQQRILDNIVGSLHDSMLKSLEFLGNVLPQFSEENSLIHARYHMEYGLFHHYYGQDTLAVNHFVKAQKSSGLKWKVTGELGRRTRFQTFDVSQLLIIASSANKPGETVTSSSNKAPENVLLNDDTLLENIQFSKDDDVNEKGEENEADSEKDPQNNLKIIDQCILLAFCLNVKNTNPSHGITTEQMVPYVSRVLENPNNWMVHTMGLLLRSRLEKDKSRTVERSILQLQALVEQFPLELSSAQERIEYFYQILLPSKWDMEKELAERFMSLGVIRSALQIFERLEMWEEIINCYVILEKENKAKEIIHERLNITPNSSKLYCILGDIEKDPKHWEHAWEISGNRYARAMRSLGGYWYKQQQYQKSIECYAKALKINTLFENSWFMQGCAAMHISDWDIAIQAFMRVISIDPENSEAWNNLASNFIKQGRKVDAFNAFQQALKQNYDSWKIWTNYMYTAIDIGEFSEAIRAMQRIVDLRWEKEKEKCVDLEVLEIIINSVTRKLDNNDQKNLSRLAPKVERLLTETITSRLTTNPKIWHICADFWFWQKQYDRCLEAHLKAYRCVLHDPRLDTSLEVFNQVAAAALSVVETYQNLGDLEIAIKVETKSNMTNDTSIDEIENVVCKDWRYQAKTLLRTLIGRTKDSFEGSKMHDQLKATLKELSS